MGLTVVYSIFDYGDRDLTQVAIRLAHRRVLRLMTPFCTTFLRQGRMVFGRDGRAVGVVFQVFGRSRRGLRYTITHSPSRTYHHNVGVEGAMEGDFGHIYGDGVLVIIHVGTSYLTMFFTSFGVFFYGYTHHFKMGQTMEVRGVGGVGA